MGLFLVVIILVTFKYSHILIVMSIVTIKFSKKFSGLLKIVPKAPNPD